MNSGEAATTPLATTLSNKASTRRLRVNGGSQPVEADSAEAVLAEEDLVAVWTSTTFSMRLAVVLVEAVGEAPVNHLPRPPKAPMWNRT